MQRSIVTFALLLALSTPPAQAEGRCAAEENLRSANSNSETSVTFINGSGGPVSVFWINFDGAREFYAEVPPNGSWDVRTYVTHPWVVEHESGGCMGVYFPELRHRDIRIG
jgi:hypothetical protein